MSRDPTEPQNFGQEGHFPIEAHTRGRRLFVRLQTQDDCVRPRAHTNNTVTTEDPEQREKRPIPTTDAVVSGNTPLYYIYYSLYIHISHTHTHTHTPDNDESRQSEQTERGDDEDRCLWRR